MTDILVLFALLVAGLAMIAVIVVARAITRAKRRAKRSFPLLAGKRRA